MNKTKIEWCDMTWNPVTGCLHGCEYCYARKIAKRFGQHKEAKGIVELHWKRDSTYPYDFYPTFHKYRLGEPARKTKGQNIFVCSMADLFGNWIPDEWITEVFTACENAPQHNYIFLTKNPKRYVQFDKYMPHNMWFGWSQTKPREVEAFLTHHSWNTFVSIEPIHEEFKEFYPNNVEWVIIGAETGNRKGKIIPKKEWIDSIVYRCKQSYLPVFMKNSLISVMGEENMLREFPEGLRK